MNMPTNVKTEKELRCESMIAAHACALDDLAPGSSIIQIKAACAACQVTQIPGPAEIALAKKNCILDSRKTWLCDQPGPCEKCPRKKEAF